MTQTHRPPVRARLAADTFDEDADVWRFHGTVIENGETTRGRNSRKHWPAETLEAAAGQLEGKPVVDGHGYDGQGRPTNDATVGKVVADWHDPTVGWRYEMEVGDAELARKLHNGHLEVSFHGGVVKGGETDDGAAIIAGVTGRDLAIVPYGGARGNDVEPGEAPDAPTSAVAMSASYDDADLVAELQDVGDAVRWESDASGNVTVDGTSYRYGVVVDGLQDGDEPDDSLLVAVYEPAGDEWDNRNEQNAIAEDRLDVVGDDGVGSLPAISQVTNAHDTPTTDMTDSDPDDDAGLEDIDLEGRIVIDEERHAELTALETEIEDLREETDDLESELEAKQEEVEEVRDVFAAELADQTGHSAEFYEDREVAALRSELASVLDVEEDEAAEAALGGGGGQPQTGDGGGDTPVNLDDDDREEIESMLGRAEMLEGADAEYATELREEAAEAAGVDDPAEIEEVL